MALHYWPFDWSELLCRGPITDGDCQQKFFKLPVLLFFSAISAFYIGWKQSLILRNSTQLWMIHLRAVVTLFLAAAPAVRCCVAIIGEDVLLPIDIMFSCYEAIAWIVHFGRHGRGKELVAAVLFTFCRFLFRLSALLPQPWLGIGLFGKGPNIVARVVAPALRAHRAADICGRIQ